MKKIIAIILGAMMKPMIQLLISLTLFLTMVLTISSCSFFETPETVSTDEISSNDGQAMQEPEMESQITTSGMSVTIFIPDYRALAEQGVRAVAPQTEWVRFSIAEGNTFVQHGDLLKLDTGTLTPVQGAPANLPGRLWNGAFDALECITYPAGSLKIELLDINEQVVTSGVNQDPVTVTEEGSPASAVFYTTPYKYNGILGSLDAGDMVFWKVQLIGGYKYRFTLTAEGSWPDIVVFNDDGTFREYRSVSNSAQGQIDFNPTVTDDCYFGVWADAGNVTSYSVSLSYVFDLPQSEIANLNGWTAAVSGTNTGSAPLVAPVLVTKDEKSAVEFSAPKEMINNGRARFSRTFNFDATVTLTFNVKTDIGGSAASTFFKLYIDDVEKGSYYGLGGGSWKANAIIIPAGNHKIEWVLEKDSSLYYQLPYTNKVWLADVSFVRDVTEYLDISPKGPKDIYVGAPWTIQYSAKALRSDGSVRSDTSGITFSGTGVNPATGEFTAPATPGTYRVTASKDGKTVSSDVIIVHSENYMREPYTNPATGKTYYGYQGVPGEMSTYSGYVIFNYPAEKNVTADGFVTLEGEITTASYFQITVNREGNTSARTMYELYGPGHFCIRVWLRFGPGLYQIANNGGKVFTVTNTCTDTGVGYPDDPRFLYPSSVSQSDDFRITNLVSDILYGVSNEGEKIKIIHDYLVQNTVYDDDSLVPGARKGQDALTVLGKRYKIDSKYDSLGGHYLAVCEGYTNAATAMLRAAGIETRYVSSSVMNHAWNQVWTRYTGTSATPDVADWKFMDVTWDDPGRAGVDGIDDWGPTYVRYTYYLLTTMDGYNGDHPGGSENTTRSVGTPMPPWRVDMPDGWY